MAAETFKLKGGRAQADGADLATELYQYGFPTASHSSGVITIAPSELAGTDARVRFEHLLRVCEAAGCRLEYVASS